MEFIFHTSLSLTPLPPFFPFPPFFLSSLPPYLCLPPFRLILLFSLHLPPCHLGSHFTVPIFPSLLAPVPSTFISLGPSSCLLEPLLRVVFDLQCNMIVQP